MYQNIPEPQNRNCETTFSVDVVLLQKYVTCNQGAGFLYNVMHWIKVLNSY